MAYRLGVDVGGTFTDLFLVDDGDHRQWRVKTPSTPSRPVAGRARPASPHLRGGRDRARGPRQRRPRHDRRDQRRARVQGRPRRPDHDAGLRPDPAPRALADARARWPAGSSWSSPTRRPRWPTRARPSSGWTRAGARSSPVDREQVEGDHRGPRRLRRRVAHDHPDQLLRRRRATSSEIADLVEELHPGLPGHDLQRRAARVPRVRAHADGVHELLRAPAGGALRRPPAVRAARTSA